MAHQYVPYLSLVASYFECPGRCSTSSPWNDLCQLASRCCSVVYQVQVGSFEQNSSGQICRGTDLTHLSTDWSWYSAAVGVGDRCSSSASSLGVDHNWI